MKLEEFEREIKQYEEELKKLVPSNPLYPVMELELLRFKERYGLTKMSVQLDKRGYKK